MINKRTFKKYCNRAIENILYEGITDVELFNKPFELELLKKDDVQKEIRTIVYNSIVSSIGRGKFDNLKVHKLGYVFMPKKSLSDFRKCALTDIYDEIVYLTIVLSMAHSIEGSRIRKSKNMVYSYRYVREGSALFDKEYTYTKFRGEIERKSNLTKNKVLVECDISNYYDRVNLHRIESILRSINGIDEELITLLNELLLFWADRDSYGIPVGSNASRILAEVALIEVDNYLISKNIDFCRYVDDYRIFARDAFEAHSNLAILNHILSKEGLFLNNQKTNIKDISHKNTNLKTITDEKPSEGNSKAMDSTMDFQNINMAFNDETVDRPKIIRGYSGLIPTKFRKLSVSEIENLKSEDLEAFLKKMKVSILIEPKEMTTLVRTIIAQEQYKRLVELPSIIKKFPQFIPYFVDVLLKNSEFLEYEDLVLIQDSFKEWMNNPDTPEYIQIYLIRLYASEPFQNKDILLGMFRNLKRNSGDYVGRALLEALEGLLSRGELLEIKEYYYRADMWEKRQILKLVNLGLSDGEKRPFFKDVQIHEDDFFIKNTIK